jgi:uncharacterized membrane protein
MKTIDGQRFVRMLIAFLVALLLFAFAGWFWTKFNRTAKQQIGVPMKDAPELDRTKSTERQP